MDLKVSLAFGLMADFFFVFFFFPCDHRRILNSGRNCKNKPDLRWRPSFLSSGWAQAEHHGGPTLNPHLCRTAGDRDTHPLFLSFHGCFSGGDNQCTCGGRSHSEHFQLWKQSQRQTDPELRPTSFSLSWNQPGHRPWQVASNFGACGGGDVPWGPTAALRGWAPWRDQWAASARLLHP